MNPHIANLIGSLAAALASGGAAAFNAALQPEPQHPWRGATPAKYRREKTSYVQGLMNHWAKKRREAMPKEGKLRDEHGAFTLVGNREQSTWAGPTAGRRMWLAGVSAQRGY